MKMLRAKLNEYEAQQPLIQILKNELLAAQRAIREASRSGALISGSAPLRRYLAEDETKGEPVDLTFLKEIGK